MDIECHLLTVPCRRPVGRLQGQHASNQPQEVCLEIRKGAILVQRINDPLDPFRVVGRLHVRVFSFHPGQVAQKPQQYRPERPNVHFARVRVPDAQLGRRVAGRADVGAHLGLASFPTAEITKHDVDGDAAATLRILVPRPDENILGFDVSVHDSDLG